MSKRAQRRYESYKKYRQRLKKWMPFFEYWNRKHGVESWKDFEKQDYSKFLKDTSTPCSCGICSGEHYDRNKKKNFDRHIIDEELIDWEWRHGEWEEIIHWDEEDDWDYWNELYREAS